MHNLSVYEILMLVRKLHQIKICTKEVGGQTHLTSSVMSPNRSTTDLLTCEQSVVFTRVGLQKMILLVKKKMVFMYSEFLTVDRI